MKKVLLSCLATLLVASMLVSCTKREYATVAGAGVGAVAGNVITGGSTAGTVVGAVGGGVIGNQMAR